MAIDWTPFVELVREHQRFLLMTHVRPDGDALGSELALAAGLRSLGKNVRTVIASSLPPRYRFLDPDSSKVEVFTPPGETFRNVDAVIIVDTGTWNQLGDFGPFLKTLSVPRLVIDHHRTQDNLGGIHLVDTTAEAAGRLVYEACQALNCPLTSEIADALFLAVATDTGWFHHSNTTPATFELACKLTHAGANPNALYDQLYDRNSLGKLRLSGRALERLRTSAKGQVAWTEIHLSDFPDTGSTPPDTEDLINYPRSVEGVEVALLFIEQVNGAVKASFRSRSVIDVDRIAEKFNGGGHRLASGATINGTMEDVRRQVLAVVERALGEINGSPLAIDSHA